MEDSDTLERKCRMNGLPRHKCSHTLKLIDATKEDLICNVLACEEYKMLNYLKALVTPVKYLKAQAKKSDEAK